MPEQSQKNPTLILGPNPTGQVLYFFGARHTNDPTNIQFNYLKQFWDEFLNIIKDKRVVFTEGVIRATSLSYEDSIQRYGEAGAAQWLAKEADIDAVCPEPSDEEQRRSLCTLFNPQLIAYTMIVQHLAVWFRYTRQLSFNQALVHSVNRETKFADIYGFTPDKYWFDEQHKKLFDKQKLEDKALLYSISDPRSDKTLINKVVATRSNMRNEHILSVISEAWESGKSIFIIYGKGHFNALKHAFEKLKTINDSHI